MVCSKLRSILEIPVARNFHACVSGSTIRGELSRLLREEIRFIDDSKSYNDYQLV